MSKFFRPVVLNSPRRFVVNWEIENNFIRWRKSNSVFLSYLPGKSCKISQQNVFWLGLVFSLSLEPPIVFFYFLWNIWSPHYKKNIARWLEDMNFMFSWPLDHEIHFFEATCNIPSIFSNYVFHNTMLRWWPCKILFVYSSPWRELISEDV